MPDLATVGTIGVTLATFLGLAKILGEKKQVVKERERERNVVIVDYGDTMRYFEIPESQKLQSYSIPTDEIVQVDYDLEDGLVEAKFYLN